MTNAEKYQEIFGFPPDTGNCPTEDCNNCPCKQIDNNGNLACIGVSVSEWWNNEYKDNYRARQEVFNKLIELFNKYDILLVHIDGKIVPVKNSTKQECYNLLYEVQELIEWRKLLFNKHLNEVYDNGKEETT